MAFRTETTPARTRTHQPCAACKMLRRRCDVNCILAPYFPGDEPEKFAGVHKVFGASNVIKMIQMVEDRNREDTAKARMRDPVYGSAGTIFHLQQMVKELKAQLESTNARVLELQQQKDELLLNVEFDYLDLQSLVDQGCSFPLDCGDSMAYNPNKFPLVSPERKSS